MPVCVGRFCAYADYVLGSCTLKFVQCVYIWVVYICKVHFVCSQIIYSRQMTWNHTIFDKFHLDLPFRFLLKLPKDAQIEQILAH